MNRQIPRVLAALVAVGLSSCAYESGYRDEGRYDRGDYNRGHYADSSCRNCGVVERIEGGNGNGRTSGGGAVIGAVVGGVIGNQIGSGDGRKVATVAGAVAGGIAGNEIEKNRDSGGFDVYVRTDEGRAIIARQRDLNGIREGDRVEVRDGRAWALR